MWTILLLFYVQAQSECRAISLSGGGTHGSYQAGAFNGLIDNLPASQVAYNLAVGISAGSLNAGAISLWKQGQEKEAAALVYTIWSNLTGSDNVYVYWPGGVIQGLLFKKGVVDTEPERKLMEHYMTSIKRNVTLGTTNLQTGVFKEFNQTLPTNADLIQAAMTSSAIPFVFPFQELLGGYYIDGGVTYINDIYTAVQRCLEVTSQVQSTVTIDMVACSAHQLTEDEANLKSLDVLLRVWNIQSYDRGMRGLEWAMKAYPEVKFRYYVQPSKNIGGSLDFDYKELIFEIGLGRNDTKYLIDNNIYAKDVLDDWKKKPDRVYISV